MMLTGVRSEGMWVAIQRIASLRADSSPVLLDMRAAPRKEGSELVTMTGQLSVCEKCWSVSRKGELRWVYDSVAPSHLVC